MPPHPGPTETGESDGSLIQLDCINITSLKELHPRILETRNFDAIFCQEVSVPTNKISEVKQQITDCAAQTKQVVRSWVTGPDPDLTHVTGGVGVLFKNTVKVLPLKPHDHKLAQLTNCGRYQLLSLLLPSNLQIFVANIYGWVGGAVDAAAASRTKLPAYCYLC